MQNTPQNIQFDRRKREEVLNKVRTVARQVQDRVNRVLAEEAVEEEAPAPPKEFED